MTKSLRRRYSNAFVSANVRYRCREYCLPCQSNIADIKNKQQRGGRVIKHLRRTGTIRTA